MPKQQCKNTNNKKNKEKMYPTKPTSPIGVHYNKNHPEESQDAEYKRIIIYRIKKFKPQKNNSKRKDINVIKARNTQTCILMKYQKNS